MAELIYLPVADIYPHPDNPRKDLGDLTELADSIKANGVLQNLTVVDGHTVTLEEHIAMCKLEGVGKDVAKCSFEPGVHSPDGYTVIIGHRRLAAAKLAGLERVPCVIAELSAKEQARTMLMENIQRSDLTVYEQAQGFQLMLNMGETVESIAKDSGFSTTTVRRRVKLLDLDAEKFKKSEARGATLRDYMELDKIEDPDLKNKVLDAIGTDNFRNTLKTCLEEDKLNRLLVKWEAELSAFATKIESSGTVGETPVPMSYFGNYSRWNMKKEVSVPADAGAVKYYYTLKNREINVYREMETTAHTETAEERRRRKREEDSQKKEEMLDEISSRHFDLRKEFVSNFHAVKKHGAEIMSYAADVMIDDIGMDGELLCEVLGFDYDENMDEDGLRELLKNSELGPETILLATAYAGFDSPGESYFSHRWYDGCNEFFYECNDALDRLYDFLISLGYEMSDEEKAMRDGTHEVFNEQNGSKAVSQDG